MYIKKKTTHDFSNNPEKNEINDQDFSSNRLYDQTVFIQNQLMNQDLNGRIYHEDLSMGNQQSKTQFKSNDIDMDVINNLSTSMSQLRPVDITEEENTVAIVNQR